MIDFTKTYIGNQTKSVYNLIRKFFDKNKNDFEIINKHFTNRLSDKKFRKFQEYYSQTLNSESEYYKQEGFFRQFRAKYSLRGINLEFLEKLDNKRNELHTLIQENNLPELYEHFHDRNSKKRFGSFFTKYAHTFSPEKYFPIDNPIKNYFNLRNESYFISLIVISNASQKWSNENRQRIEKLKDCLIKADKKKIFDETQITDLKLLNIIFWSETNPMNDK